MVKLYLGSDHRGFELKEALKPLLEDLEVVVVDCGAKSFEPRDDYPDFGFRVGEKVVSSLENGVEAYGILLCGSGIGMTIAANKVPGITAALINAKAEEAQEDRLEHNSNVLVLSADECDAAQAFTTIKSWLDTDFEGGRHLRRMNKIRFYEQLNLLPFWTKPLIVPVALMTEDETEFRRAFANLKQFAPMVNIDVAEREFVGSDTLGVDFIVDFLKELITTDPELLVSLHLMLKNPVPALEKLNNLSNVLLVYVHHEADISAVKDREWSFQLGLTLNPSTAVTKDTFLGFEHVQLMSVEPGAQGKEFDPSVLIKADELREAGFTGQIHFDGAINETTLEQFLTVKPDVLNVGSAIVKQPEPMAAYFNLVNAL